MPNHTLTYLTVLHNELEHLVDCADEALVEYDDGVGRTVKEAKLESHHYYTSILEGLTILNHDMLHLSFTEFNRKHNIHSTA